MDAKRTGACVQGAAIVFPFAPHAEGERASGDDEVYVYAYCPEMEEGVLSASTYRRTKNVTITLPDRWQGKEVHFYGFAVDYEGNASATTYLGLLEATPVETQRTVYRKSENSHCFVEKNLWHGSCNQNNSSTFASRNLVTKWKQT